MSCYKYIVILLLAVSIEAIADNTLGYEPPLAIDALPKPEKTQKQINDDKDEADRVKYSVYYGSHDFHKLDAVANNIIDQYEAKQISADDFILKFYLLVPNKSGKAYIPDIIQWTKEYPASYAAWYVLGRQYLHIATAARGGKWASQTAKEQFAEMDKYAKLSRDALLQSLKLYGKPMPSYRTLIQTHHYIHNAEPNKDYAYLQDAVTADPDSKLIYRLYLIYNRPRWGGSFDSLISLLEQAKTTDISKEHLTELNAYLMELYADYASDIQKKPSLASQLYEKAFDINPIKEKTDRLFWAASQAKKANNIDRAISLYTKIIGIDPHEHEAFFERGAILRDEGRDLKQHFSDMIAAAKLGNKYAQNNIGYYYLTGDRGFPVNLQQAKAWLQLSADQGYEHAKKKLSIVEEKLNKLNQQEYATSKPD